jgi:hypothetical protein
MESKTRALLPIITREMLRDEELDDRIYTMREFGVEYGVFALLQVRHLLEFVRDLSLYELMQLSAIASRSFPESEPGSALSFSDGAVLMPIKPRPLAKLIQFAATREQRTDSELRAKIQAMGQIGIFPSLHAMPAVEDLLFLVGDLSLLEIERLTRIAEDDHNAAVTAEFMERRAARRPKSDP